jgi:transmembrane sensor
MENNMQIQELIDKFYLGTVTSEERTLLLSYLKEKEPLHEVLAFYQNEWDKSSVNNNDIDSERIYNETISRLGVGMKSLSGNIEKVKPVVSARLVMRYAAIFIFAFGLSWFVHSYYLNQTLPAEKMAEHIQSVKVPYGSKSHVLLSDGTVVILNSGSSLKYSDSGLNSNNRSVFLTGEGFFNVTKDSTRPFYVTTQGIKVKVLGTTFNIKAYPEEDIEETTLVTGKVEIYSSSDKSEVGNPIILKPNQRAVFIKSEKKLRTLDSTELVAREVTPVKLRKVELQPVSRTEQTISWKDNKLIFDNEPFSSLAVKIERWYDVKIIINYPQLNSARFTGKFDKETLEQVFSALVTVIPFDYDINKNLITISKN